LCGQSAISIAIRKGARHALIGPTARQDHLRQPAHRRACALGGEILLDGESITNLEPHRRVRLGIARTSDQPVVRRPDPIETLGLASPSATAPAATGGASSGSRAGITAEWLSCWNGSGLSTFMTERTAILPYGQVAAP